jgi:hypothetical protein
MDRVVLDEHDRFCRPPGLRTVDAVELLEVNDEIARLAKPVSASCRAAKSRRSAVALHSSISI